jgi:hypothetical protein
MPTWTTTSDVKDSTPNPATNPDLRAEFHQTRCHLAAAGVVDPDEQGPVNHGRVQAGKSVLTARSKRNADATRPREPLPR